MKRARLPWIWIGALAAAGACAEGRDVDDGAGPSAAGGSPGAGRGPSAFGGGPPPNGGSASGGGGRAGGATATAGTAPEPAGAGGEGGGAVAPEPEVCVLGEGGAASGERFAVTLEANTLAPGDFPQGEASITNLGAAPVSLAELEVRYYFKSEYGPADTPALEVRVHYADVSGGRLYRAITALVSGEVTAQAFADPSADAFVSIRFDSGAGELEPGERTAVQFQLRPPAGRDEFYALQDQSNDYSFGACWLRPAPWPALVLLHAGEVASGSPPPGGDDGDGGAGGGGGSGGASSD